MEATHPVLRLRAAAPGENRRRSRRRGTISRSPSSHGQRKIGVLVGSAAEQYLTTATRAAASRSSATTAAPTPCARSRRASSTPPCRTRRPRSSIARAFPRSRSSGQPVGRGYYVIYARKGDTELVRAINEALGQIIRTRQARVALPRLRHLGRRTEGARRDRRRRPVLRVPGYVGRAAPEGLAAKAAAIEKGESRRRSRSPRESTVSTWCSRYGLVLLQSAGLTVVLSCLSFPLAVALGLLVALGRLYGPRWLESAARRVRRVPAGHAGDAPALLHLLLLAGGGHQRARVLDRHPGAQHQLLGVRVGDLPRRSPGRSERADGGGARARHEPPAGPAPHHRSAGGAHRGAAGRQRLHRSLQGHQRVLGGHLGRAHQALLGSVAEHAGDRRAHAHDRRSLPRHELPASLVARRLELRLGRAAA